MNRTDVSSPADCNTCDLGSECREKLDATTNEDWLKGETRYVPGLDCPRKKDDGSLESGTNTEQRQQKLPEI